LYRERERERERERKRERERERERGRGDIYFSLIFCLQDKFRKTQKKNKLIEIKLKFTFFYSFPVFHDERALIIV